MAAPNFESSDFLSLLQALMPRGRVWPKDLDSIQAMALSGTASTYARIGQADAYLLVDTFPATAVGMLPEWESALGLPDPCAGPDATLQQRQGQVVARLTNSGGQSIPFFVAYAAALGYNVTTTEFAPFRVGQSKVGDPVGNEEWAYTWRINAPAETITHFTTGNSTVGQPLEVWGNDVLQCELNAIKPAHTVLIFAYGQTGRLSIDFTLGQSSLL